MDIWHLTNKITLKFYDQKLESEYLIFSNIRQLMQVRFALFSGIILYILFGFLDYYLYPDIYSYLLKIRFIYVVPILFILFIFLYSKFAYKVLQEINLLIVIIAGMGIVEMIRFLQVNGYKDNIYFSGLILVFFYAYTYLGLRFKYALFSSLIIILAYEFVSIKLTKIPLKNLVANNYFFISTNLLGVFVGYFQELNSRKYFLLLKELEKEKEKLEKSNVKLSEMVHLDGLTGIGNKRYLLENLEKLWQLHKDQNIISVLMIDVDFFKNYNDTYGHIAGDECLKKISSTIMEVVRSEKDIVGRFGGEEFMVILPYADEVTAFKIAERIRKKIEQLKIEHISSKVSNVVTVSIGLATTIPHNDNYEKLVECADKALYTAKNLGRNRVEVYH
ncbi:conserved hypothetical protein [Deferribacter desulfuricans SSM1]|uniref:diguanylate cyclase n=1 Tax=Deferribacter desulfuricans (strain DSM 14783 / JCM 11476 / NBRC 101012 / SSM1) TaxID=639282 RepID=D3PDK8_DEFDS|nr:diguanylate cyclase [Deferribacter desulfuricans]BAI80681.1 conserved hypothetical protein [Deferribacter desulfuricans SSM1]